MHEIRSARAADPTAAQPQLSMFALGMWIRLGFAGVSVLLAALLSLFDRSDQIGAASTLALAGAWLAIVAGLRVRSALREEQPAPPLARHAAVNP